MSEPEKRTLKLIHTAARAEFMEKGFQSASLRNIVKTAGVTTGAFYGYYGSKEELFAALVGEQYNTFLGAFQKAVFSFQGVHDMVLYAYNNLAEFKLLLCCSEGTRFAGLIDEMVKIEEKATHDFYEAPDTVGQPSQHIDPQLAHILITGMFSTLFELIIHEIPVERAEIYLSQIWDFYCAGWYKIMGASSPYW